jgi:hypothetical protein
MKLCLQQAGEKADTVLVTHEWASSQLAALQRTSDRAAVYPPPLAALKRFIGGYAWASK